MLEQRSSEFTVLLVLYPLVNRFLLPVKFSFSSQLAPPTLAAERRVSVKTMRLVTLATIILLSLSFLWAEAAVYPDEFRRWVHVGTGVLPSGANPQLKSEEGMHHIFANDKAVAGYSSGDFPDGSIVVYELREAQQKNGVFFEGERKRVDVMIKDSRKYQETGGWHFERFWGTDRTHDAIQDSGTTCFACHSNAKTHGFVFSELH